MEKKIHETHTTTLRVNAGSWPYSCGFFCQRLSTSDVVDHTRTPKPKPDNQSSTKMPVSG
jgi:hypothetical protein